MTYRTKKRLSTTIYGADEHVPVAIVLNGNGELAERIVELLNGRLLCDERLISTAHDGYALAKLIVEYLDYKVLAPDTHRIRETARAVIAKTEKGAT
jgi:hypothetical protein